MKISVSILLIAISLTWTSVDCDSQEEKLSFFLRKSPEQDNVNLLVAVSMDRENQISSQCKIFTNKEQIKAILLSSDDSHIHTLSGNDIQYLLKDCMEFSFRRKRRVSLEGTTMEKRTTRKGSEFKYDIFPGTKWCGPGNIAKNYNDLGPLKETDKCCRTHDHCKRKIDTGETKYNLTNTAPGTKLSCKCDHKLYRCLERVNTVDSNSVGNAYFNILRNECFKKMYPKTKECKKYKTKLKLICEEYKRDKNAPKEYQFVPAKFYKKIPVPGPIEISFE